jgi:ABC-type multidrug transport system fused ATPase/permease subunit/CRP-like cAMP-binding protein
MESSLFSFIWKYSKRQQLVLLAMTLVTFPFLYVSLELPKRIINDAIGAELEFVTVWGYRLTQVEYLIVLCLLFLAAVLVGGLMKMRLNTMKGVLSERMLRRLRYTLISRMMRFPLSYFQSTSQGELVSMITSEAEPMGGLMGDAIAQPVFQLGQMLTIVTFLFVQSVWFGLASVALIPLQAWLIPMLQRQINLLNKERIQEVRHLASEIGESAAGISDLRANGGWRYRLALISDRLGRLFEIRFDIYRKKFFMKFLNNLITHLTPFFFYSVGGYLAIQGEITVGALVAALGAYKDLSSPWKELLTYYNQVQDMSLRWTVVTERFAPKSMIPEELFDGEPTEIPHLDGTIEMQNVTVRDRDGNTVLEDIDLTIPPQARVAIQSSLPAERNAFAQLLTRELLPVRGSITLSGHPLEKLHQMVLATRIGYAHSRPYFFDGNLGQNLAMPLRGRPEPSLTPKVQDSPKMTEALRSGNSTDPIDVDWVPVNLEDKSAREDIRNWWFQLVQAMGIDEQLFRRALLSHFQPNQHPALAQEIVKIREEVRNRLRKANLDEMVYRFDPREFNPAVPLGGNLLFAAPSRDISQESLAAERQLIDVLHQHGIADEALAISLGVIDTLEKTFGRDGTTHPLFLKLGIEHDVYLQLCDIADRYHAKGKRKLNDDELSLLLTVPFLLTAEQIGPSFPEEYKEKILAIRKSRAKEILGEAGGIFEAVAPDRYLPRLTVLENALYGRISIRAGAKAQQIEDLVAKILDEHDLRKRLAAILYDLRTGLGGSNLPTVFQERAAFTRAGIKRPDILIMDTVLASHDSEQRLLTRERLRGLLPNSTMIFMENHFEHPERYDLFVEIRNGRIDGVKKSKTSQLTEPGSADLARKQAIIASTELFANLDERNQRLLAFSAQWYDAKAGQAIFSSDEMADAAYLCLSGRAELHWPKTTHIDAPLSIIEPGRLIGDLSIILGDVRKLDLIAAEDSSFLRIGAEEFRAVIESDVRVAVQLLETVSGYLATVPEILRASDVELTDQVANGVSHAIQDAQSEPHDG